MNTKQHVNQRPTTLKVIATLAALAVFVAACGDSSDSDMTTAAAASDTAASTTAAPATTQAPAADRAAEADLGAGGSGQAVPAALNTGRDIIFTAEMTVSVDNVADAGDRAIEIVGSFGGFLFGQRATGGAEPQNRLIFKVPPERFQETLAALGDVGDIRNQTVSADDVTEAIVDLESRITTAAASVERLRTLLEGAETVKLITELEGQLLARETSLEQMRGRLRTLEDQVSLATITVTITQAVARPGLDMQASAYLGGDDEGTSCPGESDAFSVDEDSTVTYCLEIFNVGDTALTDIEIRDAVIGKELGDFVVVFGELDVPLQPGQSVVLATTLELPRNLRLQTRVSAIPQHDDGTRLEGRSVAQTATLALIAEDPGGIPGFGEGLAESWGVLVNLVKLLILALGALLPFIWVIPLAWIAGRWQRDRRAARMADREAARQRARERMAAAPPPTPPPTEA